MMDWGEYTPVRLSCLAQSQFLQNYFKNLLLLSWEDVNAFPRKIVYRRLLVKISFSPDWQEICDCYISSPIFPGWQVNIE